MKSDPEKSRAALLRRKAEAHQTSKPPAISSPLSEADAKKLIHELEVHQIELEMQNEELSRLYEQTRHDAAVKAELLNEVNHRVKNNLMMILGLILAEERRAAAGGHHHMHAVWDKFESRINGLLHVHQMLSDSHWAPVDLDQLAERICRGAIRSSGTAGVPIDLHIGNSGVTVSPRQAGNLALVFNELVVNCMKYAFNDTNAASIRISNVMEGDRICIEFRDNGCGYPERVLNRDDWNVGLRLIDQLIEGTLGGEILLTNHNGAVTRIILGVEGT